MEDRLRVLIGEDEPVVAEGLRARLESLGHSVVGIAYDGRDAVGKAESLAPHLIFLDIKMPRLDGLAATEEIMARRPCPIVLVTAHSDPDLIDRAMTVGVVGYLVKPVDRKELPPTIALARARFADLMLLRKDVRTLSEALALRKDMERAKGILVQRLWLTEAEAHRRLQLLARRERCTLGEAAARIVATDKFYAELESLS